MERFCIARGLAVDEWLTEIGGGMDLTRREFLAVMDAIERGEIATLVIAHQDRLARFGLDYLEGVATKNDCDIVVANQQSLSPDQELVHDLVAVVHTFSSRLSGLRRIGLCTPHWRVKQIIQDRADRQRSRLPDQDSNTTDHCRCGKRNIRSRSTLIKE
jgi:hypothetical protein